MATREDETDQNSRLVHYSKWSATEKALLMLAILANAITVLQFGAVILRHFWR